MTREELGEDVEVAPTTAGAIGHPRVLAIIPWMTVGGADRYNLDVLSAAVSDGWDLTVVTTEASGHHWEPEFRALTPHIHHLNALAPPPAYPGYIEKLLVAEEPDVVLISNSETGYQLLPFMRSVAPNTAFIDLVHAEQPEWKDGGFARYSVLYGNHLDLTITVSQHLADWMMREGRGEQSVEVCRAGVDPTWWSPDPSNRRETLAGLGLDPDSVVATFSGHLTDQKRPDLFIEAVAFANSLGPKCSAVLVGQGAIQEALATQARNLGVDAAMPGVVDAAGMRAILRATDVAILPSIGEGISISLMEAMSCAVPVISARVGGQSELVSPECGILIEPSDRSELVVEYGSALSDLARDRARRVLFGVSARDQIAKGFTVARTRTRFLDLLELAKDGHRVRSMPAVDPRDADISASIVVSHVSAANEIAYYIEANAWLAGQVEAWQEESARLTDQVTELKQWIGELEAGKQWLETQVESLRGTPQETESD